MQIENRVLGPVYEITSNAKSYSRISTTYDNFLYIYVYILAVREERRSYIFGQRLIAAS